MSWVVQKLCTKKIDPENETSHAHCRIYRGKSWVCLIFKNKLLYRNQIEVEHNGNRMRIECVENQAVNKQITLSESWWISDWFIDEKDPSCINGNFTARFLLSHTSSCPTTTSANRNSFNRMEGQIARLDLSKPSS